MERNRFDEFSKALATGAPRRMLLKMLLAAPLAGILGRITGQQTETAQAVVCTPPRQEFWIPCYYFCHGLFPNDDFRAKQCICTEGLCSQCGPAAPPGHPAVCGQTCCAHAGSPCVSGSDCITKFCCDNANQVGCTAANTCGKVCAGPNSTCTADIDCTSNRCVAGHCAPTRAGNPCGCGGDCNTQKCCDSVQPGCTAANTCGKLCASPTSTCRVAADCENGNCVMNICTPAAAGAPCRCGGDCISQFCMDNHTCG